MKEYTLDFLTTTAIKYGTRIFWTAVIVFVGLRVIRMVRTAAGQIMDRAGVEITLKKFLDMLLHAVEHVQGVVEHESDSQAHGHQSNHRTDFEEPDIFFT